MSTVRPLTVRQPGVARLAFAMEVDEPARTSAAAAWPVIGVVGAVGGIGASVFAAVVAVTAGALLLDLDPAGALDTLLGIESASGARWSGLRLDGGRLDAGDLRSALPRWGPAAVLVADIEPAPGAVEQVVGSARRSWPVVLDLGRATTAGQLAAARLCGIVVLLAAPDVPALVSARRSALGIGLVAAQPKRESAPTAADGPDLIPAGLVVRSATQGAARRSAGAVGLPQLGRLPPRGVRSRGPHSVSTLPRAARIVARGLVDALAAGRHE